MQFVSAWATPDKRILVSLSETVTEIFQGHIQTARDDREAGGLLLGSVHGVNIAISEATVPTSWDKRLRHLFERMPMGHKAVAEARWLESGGTVRYLGEWHTHPEDHPCPSGIDRSEWKKLVRKRVDRRPLLAIVVGRKSLHVELVEDNGFGPVLVPTR